MRDLANILYLHINIVLINLTTAYLTDVSYLRWLWLSPTPMYRSPNYSWLRQLLYMIFPLSMRRIWFRRPPTNSKSESFLFLSLVSDFFSFATARRSLLEPSGTGASLLSTYMIFRSYMLVSLDSTLFLSTRPSRLPIRSWTALSSLSLWRIVRMN